MYFDCCHAFEFGIFLCFLINVIFMLAQVEGLMRLMEGEHVGPFNLGNPGEFTMLELAKVKIIRKEARIVQNHLHYTNKFKSHDHPTKLIEELFIHNTWHGILVSSFLLSISSKQEFVGPIFWLFRCFLLSLFFITIHILMMWLRMKNVSFWTSCLFSVGGCSNFSLTSD